MKPTLFDVTMHPVGTSNRDTELSATKYVCVSHCTHLRIIVSGISLCQRMKLFFC